MPTHLVSFAGQSIAIEYERPEIRDVLEFLYRDVRGDDRISPHVTLQIGYEDDKNFWTLNNAEQRIYNGESLEVLANILVGETIHHLTDKSKQGMALHAAALSREGRAMILPGRSGAGKSTLTSWLTMRGYNYLTDELVYIPENTRDIQYFTRPINIKQRGIPALEGEFDFTTHAEATMASKQVTMIPPRLLNPDNELERAQVELILFPQHRAETELELTKLSKAQAGLALMECLVNARNLNGHGFAEATRLAREVPAYRLVYQGFDQLGNHLDAILL